MIILLYKEAYLNANEFNDSFPSAFSSMLQEFEDLFQEEVHHRLPPIKGIKHQIDFVPKAPIPNRPTYRSNLKETKEMQWQVVELLTKGYMCESMNPCVMSVILVLNKNETWRMCVDRGAINKIIVKYHHLIPWLDDMLDELHGSCVFYKIDLKSRYHQIHMKKVMNGKLHLKPSMVYMNGWSCLLV